MKQVFAVIRRELELWRRHPVYIAGTVLVLLFCSAFYLTFMKDGVPSDLPIGIVDNDNSSMSRNFIQQVDATQNGMVIQYPDFESARYDMQRGVITSICVLPKGMYAEVQAQKQPKITFYVNTLYFLGGSLSYKTLLTMINLTSGAVQRQVLRMKGVNEHAIMGRIRPVDLDIHMIGNPTMNYGAYLANMMLPGVLQMIVIIMTIYTFGIELKNGTSRHLLSATNGSMTTVIAGKFVVYTALFCALGWSMVLILYHRMGFPLAGSIWAMLLDVTMLILASEAIGLTVLGAVPVLRFALSIGALISVMGFSMAGFTLPVETMPAAIRGLAEIFPLRHYYLFYIQEGMFGSGFAGWYHELIHLMIFLLVPIGFMPRLKKAYINLNYPRK